MKSWRTASLILIYATMWSVTFSGRTQTVSNYAVQVSVIAQTNPPQILLVWPADSGASGYTVYRKALGANTWGTGIASLGATAVSYPDTQIVVGSNYEYRVSKTASGYYGEGYVFAGIQAPLVETRGKVVLLVDNTFSTNLAMELARLQQDLVGDGWTVLRHDIPRMAVDPANTSSTVWAARSNELANAKALVRSDYLADPANVAAVFLFGHVPVPYSGDIVPDGHVPQHQGAWPADGYYGDVPYDNYFWHDSSVNDSGASDTRNWNVPGDGKFDQSIWPVFLTLQSGRVDLANLPTFSQSETELLRQYLNKDHAFRHKLVTAQRRGWIDDNFGLSTGEPFAVTGWRDFAAFFGASNTVAGSDWFGTLTSNSYLWGYGCGPGTYTSCSGVGNTANFAASDPQVVFTMFFGSYFGDWDSQDNFLRAALATPTYTLTSVWSGRPYWQFHHMGLGETIGYSTLASQNNLGVSQGGYDFNADNGFVHIALMGDPTLRMHMVAPPSALLVSSNGSGGASVSWNASPDTVLGYYVYSAPMAAGPFTRLTSSLLTVTNYTDPVVSTNVYMVRAVKLEVSGSGSYSNASQGIFQSLDGTAGAPGIILFQPTNTTTFGAWPAIQINADTFDPANSVTNVAFYANGAIIGQTNTPPYSLLWSNVSGGTYALTARALCSSGWVTNSSAVTVQVASGPVGTENTTTSLSRTTGDGSQTYGSALTFTATVTGNSTTPGGNVIFKDGPTTLATVWLAAGASPNATATYTSQTDLNVTGSPHSIAAYYQGESTHNISDSSAGAIPQTITALPVTLSGSRNYDGTATAAASILTMGNNLDGGNLTLSGSGTLSSANGGLQTISSFGGLTLGGPAAANYTLTGASGSVRINPAPGAFAIATTANAAATFASAKIIHFASDAGVTLSVSAVASPSAQGGTVALNGDNTITYTPPPGYAGADSFNYTLSDNAGGSSPGTVTVQVNAGNVSTTITAYVVNGDGSFTITASGLPGQTYDIQAADTASGPWNQIGTATALSNGVVSYTDTDAHNHVSRVYRLAQP